MSRGELPPFSSSNCTSVAETNAILLCNNAWKFSIYDSATKFIYLTLSEFAYCISLILQVRHPHKVFSMIVGSISIFMMNLMPWSWWKSYKHCGYKSMDTKPLHFKSFPLVTTLEKMNSYISDFLFIKDTEFPSSYAAYPTITRDFIARFPFWDWPPFFLVTHNKSSLQEVMYV
jgi:hypothetical protein